MEETYDMKYRNAHNLVYMNAYWLRKLSVTCYVEVVKEMSGLSSIGHSKMVNKLVEAMVIRGMKGGHYKLTPFGLKLLKTIERDDSMVTLTPSRRLHNE